MTTRPEKNRKIVKEIEKEHLVSFYKKITKIFLIIVFIIVLIYLYMRFIGTAFITTKEKYLSDNIPESFHGLKIVQLSDLLYGSTIKDKDLNTIKKEINKIKPDLIVFTGDLVANSYNLIDNKGLVSFFKDLSAPYGVYAIYGDLDKKEFETVMKESNVTVLNNETKDLFNKTTEGITIKGLNINETKDVANTDNYTICLIHNYDYFSDFNTNCDVTFAGHTLNGEIRIPYTNGLFNNNDYKKEYYKEGNNEVYISNGLGAHHKLRLFNHPSINVYRIYKK
jgi:predicted MPP superfamily phosphohydrolase